MCSARATDLLLGGYLEDNARRLALQRYLDGSGVDYRLEARSMEDIRQGVDFILQKFGYRQILSSNADKPGWVRLNGELAEQDERWARIDALLESRCRACSGWKTRSGWPARTYAASSACWRTPASTGN